MSAGHFKADNPLGTAGGPSAEAEPPGTPTIAVSVTSRHDKLRKYVMIIVQENQRVAVEPQDADSRQD